MESPVPVPLSLNPNIAIEAAKYSNTLAVDLVAQEDMPGSSRSMSPRSRASCSSKGSPKTKRPSNGKGKCAYPLGCNKYRQNGEPSTLCAGRSVLVVFRDKVLREAWRGTSMCHAWMSERC